MFGENKSFVHCLSLVSVLCIFNKDSEVHGKQLYTESFENTWNSA